MKALVAIKSRTECGYTTDYVRDCESENGAVVGVFGTSQKDKALVLDLNKDRIKLNQIIVELLGHDFTDVGPVGVELILL